jgi:hypothetical protein
MHLSVLLPWRSRIVAAIGCRTQLSLAPRQIYRNTRLFGPCDRGTLSAEYLASSVPWSLGRCYQLQDLHIAAELLGRRPTFAPAVARKSQEFSLACLGPRTCSAGQPGPWKRTSLHYMSNTCVPYASRAGNRQSK